MRKLLYRDPNVPVLLFPLISFVVGAKLSHMGFWVGSCGSHPTVGDCSVDYKISDLTSETINL